MVGMSASAVFVPFVPGPLESMVDSCVCFFVQSPKILS